MELDRKAGLRDWERQGIEPSWLAEGKKRDKEENEDLEEEGMEKKRKGLAEREIDGQADGDRDRF